MLLARPVRALLAAALAAASVAGLWMLVPEETRAARGLELGIQDDFKNAPNYRYPGRAFRLPARRANPSL